jgi:hypothetical protein
MAIYPHRQAHSRHPDRDVARPHRQHPLIKIQLMTTPRSGEVPMVTPPWRVASSSWWPRPENLHTTTPADIPPSGDLKRPVPGRSMRE